MNRTKLAFALTCAILSVGASVPAQAQPYSGRPMTFQRERHPEIRKALRALQRTRTDLNNAAHDFHGHKAAALRHIDEAIAELRAALSSDRH